MSKSKLNFSFGDVFQNPYLGDKTTEVLNKNKNRVGWIWEHSDGTVIVSPYLGFYVWYAPGGAKWTVETGCNWLIKHS